MGTDDAAALAEHRGQPDKRRAIARAARTVFGRDGFTRSGMDAIAAEAGVSKRTVYNHYRDKESLFLSVIQEGAAEVARTHTAIAERHLRKILDLEADLVAFGLEWASSPAAFDGHFALVRAIQAEAAHIPPAALRAWQEAGPLAFHRELAGQLRAIADRGLLVVPDPDKAADDFNLLTFVSVAHRSFHGALPLPDAEAEQVVRDGVATFLRLYGRPGRRRAR